MEQALALVFQVNPTVFSIVTFSLVGTPVSCIFACCTSRL